LANGSADTPGISRPEPQEMAFSSRLNFVARFVLCECKMPYFSQVKKTGIVSETLVKYLL
jgi:hypothetical protein